MSEANSLTSPVDTRRVAGRRELRFESIGQALAETDRLAEAKRAGRLQYLGNTTKQSPSTCGTQNFI